MNFGDKELQYLSAALKGEADTVRKLLQDGVDVNCRCPDINATALHFAAGAGHTDIVRLLLDHPKIRTDLRNGYGDAPADTAAKQGQRAIVELLNARRRSAHRSLPDRSP